MPSRAATRNLVVDDIFKVTPLQHRQIFGTTNRRIHLYEPFLQLPGLNGDIGDGTWNGNFELNAEAGGVSATDGAFTVDGMSTIKTPASTPAVNDFAAGRPHLDALASLWAKVGLFGSEDEVTMKQCFRLPNIVACAFLFGLKEDVAIPADMEVIGSDDNAAFFFFSDGNATSTTNFVTIENINTADTSTDTGIAVVANQVYELDIRINASREATFRIDGVVVRAGVALKDAVDFIPFFAIMTDVAGVKTLDYGPLLMETNGF